MIVPSMTFAEIYDELLKDGLDVMVKMLTLKKQYERLVLKSTRYPVIKTYEFITKDRKNKYYVTFRAKKRSQRRKPIIGYYSVFTRPEGKYAVSPSMDWQDITIYPPHFFKRFRERIVKDETISNTNLIKLYFKNDWGFKGTIVDHNFEEVYYSFEDISPDNKVSFVAAINQGYCFGEFQGKVSILKTIISEDMLFEKQKKILLGLKREFDEEMRARYSDILYTC